MTIRRILPLFFTIILSSCSSIPVYSDNLGYHWELRRNPIDRDKWQYFEKFPDEPICVGAYACAIVRQPNVFCHLHIPKGAPEWVIKHEEKHCEGWNHQARTLSEIRRFLQ